MGRVSSYVTRIKGKLGGDIRMINESFWKFACINVYA